MSAGGFTAILQDASRRGAESIIKRLFDRRPADDVAFIKDEYVPWEVTCPRCKGEGTLVIGMTGPTGVGTVRRCDFVEGEWRCREGMVRLPRHRVYISEHVIHQWLKEAERGE